MEDAHCSELNVDNSNSSFFGIYDGHGGFSVAQYTGKTLHHYAVQSPYFEEKEYSKALIEAYLKIDKDIFESQNVSYDPSGCTAVTALVTPDQKSIFVANAGDSRAVISTGGRSKALSCDHKPSDAKENERIVKAGGFVEFGRVNGNLALSRAIGDYEFKKNKKLLPEEQAVTCYPDVIEHEIGEEDEFLILACDGIWDCMTNQQVVNFVYEHVAENLKLQEVCEEIMENCLAPYCDMGGVGCDNMSIIIVAILNGKTEEEWYSWIKKRYRLKKINKQSKLKGGK